MKLFEPLSIGRLILPNRIVMPAMGTSLSETNGLVSDRAIAYYSRRAAGGVGLVTLEDNAVHRLGRHRPRNFTIDRDECIEGLSRLARSVHAYGARLSVQLWHAGHIARPEFLGEPPVSASTIPAPGRSDPPRQLTEAGIEELVECFGQGARRAREAGCDAVEVHAAHGYLLNQFLSPLHNRRTDRYGGELRNRARFLLEVVARIKLRAGADFPVLCKLSESERIEGGATFEETRQVARWLEEAGADALLISSGGWGALHWMVQPMMQPRGCLVPFAAEIKSLVSIPVGTVGRINNPELAEQILQEGKADFVAMGRALLADPDLPCKAREGRSDEIRLCTACRVCTDRDERGIQCMVNPEVGRELEWKIEPAPRPKRVLVVGAGPGGMEAASVAARRGHRVTLCEQSDHLGGMLALGSKPPSKAELRTVAEYYARELDRNGVEVRAGRRVTAETVRDMRPEVVVVATGSIPTVPPIPGVERPNVVQAREVLADRVDVGRSAVVIGGGSVGCETAEYIAASGVRVVVVEMLDSFAQDMDPATRQMFLPHLRSLGVEMLPNTRAVRIEGDAVLCATADGREVAVRGETIVLAVGARPDTELLDSLKSLGLRVVAVGDCVEPRRIRNAVLEGAQAARRI